MAITQPRPKKPRKDWPLFPHRSGMWCKKIGGKAYYFGPWSDPQGALDTYQREVDYIREHGCRPSPTPATLADAPKAATVRCLVNAFLTSKRPKVATGELSRRTFSGYFEAAGLLVEHFGRDRRLSDLGPRDFEEFRAKLAERYSPVSLANRITTVRVILNYAFDHDLVLVPIRVGKQAFAKPRAEVLRRERLAKGPRMLEAADLRLILDALAGKEVPGVDPKTGEQGTVTYKANPQLRAMVLLALNAGYGQTDLAHLPQSALDLDRGWSDYPRIKTAVPRRCPLWPETVEAVRAAIAARPKPKNPDDDALVFLTKYGAPWVRTVINERPNGKSTTSIIDGVCQEFGKVLRKLSLRKKGINFYSLRRVVETVGSDSCDQVAVDAIMGHAPASDDMADRYRERISDARLRRVTDTIRTWLFMAAGPSTAATDEAAATIPLNVRSA